MTMDESYIQVLLLGTINGWGSWYFYAWRTLNLLIYASLIVLQDTTFSVSLGCYSAKGGLAPPYSVPSQSSLVTCYFTGNFLPGYHSFSLLA